MVNFRRSLGFLSLISFVYNVTAQEAAPTTADPSPTEVVVPSSQVAALSDSPVIDDPTLIESLFSPIVDSTNNSTLLVERSGDSDCKCYPGQACWPAQIAWDLLNLTLSGQLIKYVPAAAPCHNSFEGRATYDAGQCAVINGPSGWGTEEFQYVLVVFLLISLFHVLSQYGVTHSFSVADPGSTVWEFATGNTCLPTSDPTTSCTRGNYPVYVINATCPAHIQIGVNFTRIFNIRLIIKNTGHDFLGKSLGYGSLSIWTHNLQQMNWIDKYVGPGGYTGKAARLGAGVTTKDIYQAASARSQVIVGGECEVRTPYDHFHRTFFGAHLTVVESRICWRIHPGRGAWTSYSHLWHGSRPRSLGRYSPCFRSLCDCQPIVLLRFILGSHGRRGRNFRRRNFCHSQDLSRYLLHGGNYPIQLSGQHHLLERCALIP